MDTTKTEKLLALFKGSATPTKEDFKTLVASFENHRLLAKVFILEGTPYVFKDSPMKYTVFREQVADQFDVGSQDVCIVGSARLGFSPSHYKYGKPFSETSDVDVVVISFDLFDSGSRELFSHLNGLPPNLRDVRPHLPDWKEAPPAQPPPEVKLVDWRTTKDAVRNFTYQNFNPGLLPWENPMRRDIFEKIGSTAGLFCALEPQVFVSKIRARIFRNWRAAEDYYTNTLRELKSHFSGGSSDIDDDEEAPGEVLPSGPMISKPSPDTRT